jgi:hypothetical protein
LLRKHGIFFFVSGPVIKKQIKQLGLVFTIRLANIKSLDGLPGTMHQFTVILCSENLSEHCSKMAKSSSLFSRDWDEFFQILSNFAKFGLKRKFFQLKLDSADLQCGREQILVIIR